ncbi:YdiU domain protein [Talaromyces proteolyticus]|uniref:Selenoprotein O n=1 Tax=Talaromyces proteolyticus TaxID=1131652 RepID=A0AAD4L127_9EURO|nr:YdiU domain protein [Talaromyces proteolyticus]KAH8704279.1 YdiU domain protein [Talaromyces proteolyticus]
MFRPSSIRCQRMMQSRIHQMASHITSEGAKPASGFTIASIPKLSTFTSKLPPDPAFETPASSHNAPRESLGPRLVKGAMYTYVRPEPSEEPELLSVSPKAMEDLGLQTGEEKSADFRGLVAGNKIFWSEEEGGVYPWAQCYGGMLVLIMCSGSWAGQLGDGRAISLFELINPATGIRYELQLKGAGRTPYSRFADGKAVLRSSIREYVVSEALNALGIPTTRALSLTLLPHSKVLRERTEPGAIVARFAESWLRIGSFDILHSRNDRNLIRKLATFVAEDVFPGWESLPSVVRLPKDGGSTDDVNNPARGVKFSEIQGEAGQEENRFTRLYREIVRRNAKTVAAWQAYGFMNGVLNTDNTSIYGLSLDYGPFAFMDNFDPSYTPNHDDHFLRYSYKNQASIIWWNLVRLGESFGELIGAADKVDDETFIEKGVTEEFGKVLVERAETLIGRVGEEYKAVFFNEYKRLMGQRLGLLTSKESDFEKLFSDLLDTMENLELDYNRFFRRLSEIEIETIETEEQRLDVARTFFHHEGVSGIGNTEESAKKRIAEWIVAWRSRILEDWEGKSHENRQSMMKAVNPKFLPRSWILDEIIERMEKKGDREILDRVMTMALDPFKDNWGLDREEEERFCGDVPRYKRAMMCSCSS